MGLFDGKNDQRDALLEELKATRDALREEVAELRAERKAREKDLGLTDKVIALKTEIENLTIERDRKKEEFERRERELTHMVGLEKKRQEQELSAGKREAVLAVKEENLNAERERFETQMDFMTKRFEKEVGYLKDIMKEMMERLPTVTVDKSITQSEKVVR